MAWCRNRRKAGGTHGPKGALTDRIPCAEVMIRYSDTPFFFILPELISKRRSVLRGLSGHSDSLFEGDFFAGVGDVETLVGTAHDSVM